MNATIFSNFDVVDGAIDPAFQHAGTWYDYFSGNTLEVVNVNDPINLKPGEYHIYTDVQLETPIILSIDENGPKINYNNMVVFPDPSTGTINFWIPEKGLVEFQLYTLTGSIINNTTINANQSELVTINLNEGPNRISPGIYIYKVRNNYAPIEGKLLIE
jgi:hypothetical protein